MLALVVASIRAMVSVSWRSDDSADSWLCHRSRYRFASES